jgi:hypothetical protein
MSKHTPGPWTATPSDPAEGVECFWISVNQQYPPPLRGFRVRDIASVHGARTEEEIANAALIAAAPDLLAALRAMLAVAERRKTSTFRTIADTARAAIAKAERHE